MTSFSFKMVKVVILSENSCHFVSYSACNKSRVKWATPQNQHRNRGPYSWLQAAALIRFITAAPMLNPEVSYAHSKHIQSVQWFNPSGIVQWTNIRFGTCIENLYFENTEFEASPKHIFFWSSVQIKELFKQFIFYLPFETLMEICAYLLTNSKAVCNQVRVMEVWVRYLHNMIFPIQLTSWIQNHYAGIASDCMPQIQEPQIKVPIIFS